jgi:DNA-directed RNA polymerase subunit RPC12/RpoP
MQPEGSPSTWEIEHQCPQCGAPITLGETDRLFSCSYCRTRLYLIPKDYFRYYLPPPDLFSNDIIFVPYWRLRGMAFFCKADGAEHRVIDVSLLASQHPFLPPSLGFRSQVLKLRFISPEIKAKFFNPRVPIETMIQNVLIRSHPLNGSTSIGPIAYKAFIGETASLIYSPIFIHQDMAHDAILGKPLAPIPKDFAEGLLSFDEQKDWQVKLVSTLCPHCGWDLLGERDSVALFCKNCNSAWEASLMGMEQVNFGMAPSKEDHVLYLPFWRMNTRLEGIKIQSYADLIRIANVPKEMKEEDEGFDLYFWSPAFKVPPHLFLRLTQGMTISQPREEFERSLPRSSLYPVTLPVSEAAESIKITIANFAIDKKRAFPKLNELKIHLNESLLVYLPFTPSGSDFIEPHTQLCIPKNLLKLGRDL